MSHEGTLILLGILVVLTPFFGLPYSWLMVIIPLLGLFVLGFAILLRARGLAEVPVHKEEAPVQSFDETPSAIA